MELFFAGAEQPVYLRQLDLLMVPRVAISFYEWQRRHSVDDVHKHIPDHIKVLITAGVAKKEDINWADFVPSYIEFCQRNADQCTFYDLDAPSCPLEERQLARDQLSLLPNFVAFPFHNDDLDGLARTYERLGINARLGKAIPAQELRRIPASLYGSNITNPDLLRQGRFTATTSFAWLSARRYGELWIFVRNKLHHYTAEQVPRAIKIHQADISSYGIEPRAALAKHGDDLVALAVRSLQAMADSLSRRVRDRGVADISPIRPDVEALATTDQTPAALTARPVQERERVTLPLLTMDRSDDQPRVSLGPTQLRSCDSCFLSDVCPLFEAGSSCGYEIPITVETPAQMEAACQFLLEMQFQRVAFARYAEQLEGGVLNSKVGQETDRWMGILKSMKELSTSPSLPEGGGAISRAFGNAQLEIGGDDDEEDDQEVFDAEEVEGQQAEHGVAYQPEGPGPSTDQATIGQATGAFEDAPLV